MHAIWCRPWSDGAALPINTIRMESETELLSHYKSHSLNLDWTILDAIYLGLSVLSTNKRGSYCWYSLPFRWPAVPMCPLTSQEIYCSHSILSQNFLHSNTLLLFIERVYSVPCIHMDLLVPFTNMYVQFWETYYPALPEGSFSSQDTKSRDKTSLCDELGWKWVGNKWGEGV